MKSTIVGSICRCLPAAGLLALGLVIGGSGCQKKAPPAEKTQTQAPAPAASAPTTPAKEDKVVVTVNGTPILESQVQKFMDLQYKPILAKYAAQSPQLAAQQEKVFRETVTQDLVKRQLLEDQAKAAGIQITDEDLTAEMTKQLASRQPPMTIPEFQKVVQEQGGDFEAMKGFLRQSLKFRKLIDLKVPATPATDADAKKYYDDNLKEFQVPEQIRASHILIKPIATVADPNQAKAQAKTKAEELLKKVKEGADFATLAKENSDCPSKDKGGDLGLFPRGPMVKPFEDAAFSLKVGEVSNLVETQFGYHIIKVTEHQDPNQITFDKAKPQLVGMLTQKKRQEAVDQYLVTLRKDAKVVFTADATPSTPTPQASAPQVTTPRPAAPKAPAPLALPADPNAGKK